MGQKHRDYWIHAMEKFLPPVIESIRTEINIEHYKIMKNILICYEKVISKKNLAFNKKHFDNLPEVVAIKKILEGGKKFDDTRKDE